MMSTNISDMFNEMERFYFFERRTGEASGAGYIAANTWRGWRASPRIRGAVSGALVAAFPFLTDRFEGFLHKTPSINRSLFDAFHACEIKALYDFLQSYCRNTNIHPAAIGSYNGYAYNSYAKILNLAYTHWCFRPQQRSNQIQYDPTQNSELLRCLHVPLDKKVHGGVNELQRKRILPPSDVQIPTGGMGAVRSVECYVKIQNYLRGVVDQIPSNNFLGNTVSPLAFDAFWGD